MENKKLPIVVVLYGAPGAGKDTQALFLVEKDFYQVSSSNIAQKKIFDPNLQNDPKIIEERRKFETGELFDPEWITDIIIKELPGFVEYGKNLVFSGSPRTLYEAEKELPVFESIFGKENVFIIEIKISPETTLFRNSHRRICEDCKAPLVYTPENAKLEKCPICGGKLITRVLDKEDIILIRIKEYQERTFPILEYAKNNGFKVFSVDGEVSPSEVKEAIAAILPDDKT